MSLSNTKIMIGTAGKPLIAKNKPIHEAPSILAKLGLKAMEYEAVRGVRISGEVAAKLAGEASNNNIKLSLHAPYYINLASPNPATVAKSLERLKRSIRIARHMNAYIVVFHPGYYTGHAERAEALTVVKNNVMKIIEYAVEAGGKTILGPETAGRIKQIGSLDEIIEIARLHEQIKPVIDWAHLYARTRGKIPRTINDALRIIDKMEKELGSRAMKPLHTHYSEIEYGKGGEIRHHQLGSGKGPDHRIICKALCETGVNTTMIIETPLLEKDAVKIMETCRDICG